MKYLISYNEKLDRDIYKSFIDRYRKTDYISKTNMKRMYKMGIGPEVFKKLENDINKCYTFFKKNDIDILKEILQYAEDDSPVSVISGFVWFSINSKSKPRSYFSLDNTNIIISEDNNGLPSRDHKRLSNRLDILNNIIESIDKVRTKSIEHWTKRKEDDSVKRPGFVDPYITMGLKGMEESDPYEVITINPQISLDFEFQLRQIGDVNDDEYYNYNGPNYTKRRDDVQKFKNLLEGDDCIGRYFRAIGYSDIKFKIYENWNLISRHVTFEIKIESF